MVENLGFNIPAKMLLKNTLFKGVDKQILTLSLDAQFSSLLTNTIQNSIQSTLQANFKDITLSINLNELTEQTSAQKTTQAKNEKMNALQKKFLADKGVQQLQQVFNTQIDKNSIKENNNV
ncbi:DNA polymerase III subunits gamma and tau [hydrothermal vent metagenome]|uniref:DNA polymerase III subunits gamma and tau n=1 Tax=hydrothermal vent metagenome TaxID=652676 RepID=A0A1W1E484_9ZZZZ